ncbi:hypothetical protein PI124_g21604 [Phytophthora idaei]|nr:hypothetical protein PI125_g23307 [Phytophthora idaei]KAG3128468.1 hypothetical protein PI126_g21383 [Phytophthora idaei]KAG3233316.1 hypothetical protein PI124_g21604 [Phytophthora idaei]
MYRWRKHAKALEANKKAGNKYYVRTMLCVCAIQF